MPEIENMFWESGLQLIHGKQQGSFTELVGMHSVTHVADGADGKQYFQPGNPRQQTGKQRGVVRHYFTDGKHVTSKARLRLLMAVGNYSSRLFIFIYPSRAESQ